MSVAPWSEHRQWEAVFGSAYVDESELEETVTVTHGDLGTQKKHGTQKYGAMDFRLHAEDEWPGAALLEDELREMEAAAPEREGGGQEDIGLEELMRSIANGDAGADGGADADNTALAEVRAILLDEPRSPAPAPPPVDDGALPLPDAGGGVDADGPPLGDENEIMEDLLNTADSKGLLHIKHDTHDMTRGFQNPYLAREYGLEETVWFPWHFRGRGNGNKKFQHTQQPLTSEMDRKKMCTMYTNARHMQALGLAPETDELFLTGKPDNEKEIKPYARYRRRFPNVRANGLNWVVYGADLPPLGIEFQNGRLASALRDVTYTTFTAAEWAEFACTVPLTLAHCILVEGYYYTPDEYADQPLDARTIPKLPKAPKAPKASQPVRGSKRARETDIDYYMMQAIDDEVAERTDKVPKQKKINPKLQEVLDVIESVDPTELPWYNHDVERIRYCSFYEDVPEYIREAFREWMAPFYQGGEGANAVFKHVKKDTKATKAQGVTMYQVQMTRTGVPNGVHLGTVRDARVGVLLAAATFVDLRLLAPVKSGDASLARSWLAYMMDSPREEFVMWQGETNMLERDEYPKMDARGRKPVIKD